MSGLLHTWPWFYMFVAPTIDTYEIFFFCLSLISVQILSYCEDININSVKRMFVNILNNYLYYSILYL